MSTPTPSRTYSIDTRPAYRTAGTLNIPTESKTSPLSYPTPTQASCEPTWFGQLPTVTDFNYWNETTLPRIRDQHSMHQTTWNEVCRDYTRTASSPPVTQQQEAGLLMYQRAQGLADLKSYDASIDHLHKQIDHYTTQIALAKANIQETQIKKEARQKDLMDIDARLRMIPPTTKTSVTQQLQSDPQSNFAYCAFLQALLDAEKAFIDKVNNNPTGR